MMDQKNLEDRLNQAVEHCASPDLLNRILSEVEGVNETMKETNNTVEMPRRKRHLVPIVAAAALAVCGVLGAWQIHTSRVPVARVALDVNPSMELTLDKNDDLLEAIPRNQDARELLDGLNLDKMPVEDAMEALVDALQQNGYLTSENGTVLISVDAKDGRGDQLQQLLTSSVRQSLDAHQLNGNVLSQQVAATDELNQQAQQWDTSFGRAAYYQKVAQSTNVDSNQLAGLTVQEAEYLLSSRGLTMADAGVECEVDDDLTAQDLVGRNLISTDHSLELALSAAGVSAEAAQRKEVELDADNGRLVFDVEFCADGIEYEISLDAETGEILTRKSERMDAEDLLEPDDDDALDDLEDQLEGPDDHDDWDDLHDDDPEDLDDLNDQDDWDDLNDPD